MQTLGDEKANRAEDLVLYGENSSVGKQENDRS